MPIELDPGHKKMAYFGIAIVGGGYSGTLLAIQLLRCGLAQNQPIALIEKSSRFGPGLAYSTEDDCCLLNVPAGNMSALPDEKEHFLNYCQAIFPETTASSFVPRRIYGQYLEALLKDTEKHYPRQLVHIRGEVLDVERDRVSQNFKLNFEREESIVAGRVVLALGHFPSQQLTALKNIPPARILDPWKMNISGQLGSSLPIVIVGSGHTAIDAVLRLRKKGIQQKIYLLSRHGLLPHCHRPAASQVDPEFPAWLIGLAPTIRNYTSALRWEVAQRKQKGIDWRDVFNEMRPYTAGLWHGLAEKERRRFLSKVLPYWDVHRHRLAPAVAQQIDGLIASKAVEVLAGRITSVAHNGNRLQVQFLPRGVPKETTLDAALIVNCTGPNYDIKTLEQPLIQSLRRRGSVTQDALKLGLAVSDDYEVIGTNGEAIVGLHYIGPMLRAVHWEAIAVPELRVHAQQLAKMIAKQAEVQTIESEFEKTNEVN